jgi:hypothetical protein
MENKENFTIAVKRPGLLAQFYTHSYSGGGFQERKL